MPYFGLTRVPPPPVYFLFLVALFSVCFILFDERPLLQAGIYSEVDYLFITQK